MKCELNAVVHGFDKMTKNVVGITWFMESSPKNKNQRFGTGLFDITAPMRFKREVKRGTRIKITIETI